MTITTTDYTYAAAAFRVATMNAAAEHADRVRGMHARVIAAARIAAGITDDDDADGTVLVYRIDGTAEWAEAMAAHTDLVNIAQRMVHGNDAMITAGVKELMARFRRDATR